MVIKQLSPHALEELGSLLTRMDVCARELELISSREYEAIRMLDSEQIMLLSDQRIVAHQCLAKLELDGENLLARANVASDISLAIVIDLSAGNRKSEYEALRRNLYERMLHVEAQSQENGLRLRAAYRVSSSILQKLGLVQQEQTYGRTASR